MSNDASEASGTSCTIPVGHNTFRGNILKRFLLVVFWAIAKPEHFVEDLAIFPKASGNDMVNNVFPVVVVLGQVYVVAVVTTRGHRCVPLVISLLEIGVVTSVDGDGRAMRVR